MDWRKRTRGERGLTLLGSVTKGLVEVVGGLRETCCVYLLFGLSMDEDNLHSPVSEWEAGDTTVCAWSRRVSVPGRVRGPGCTYITFCSVIILIVLLTCRRCQSRGLGDS